MKLRMLTVEDSEDDAALLARELTRLGYEVESQRVETADVMQAALGDAQWDLIICDYSLPSFNAPEALSVLKASGQDIPFIILSGTIGEETAVASMKAGAHDFLLKYNLARLGPVIERELRDAATRREHRRAQEALAASEAQLRALFASMQDVVFVIDRNGVYRQFAPTSTDLLYALPQELLGRSLIEVMPKENAQQFMAAIEKVIESQTTTQIEYSLSIGGRLTWFDASISPMTKDSTLWVVRDISDRKKAERVLMESEARFRTFIEESADGAVLVNEQGVIEEWNQAQAAITGIPRAQAIGTPFWEVQYQLLVPERREGRSPELFKTLMQDVFRTGHSPQFGINVELEILTTSGSRKTITQSSFPIKTEAGYRMGSIIRDITGRKEAEEVIHQHLAGLEIVYESGLALNQLLNPKEIAQKVIDLMRQKLDWHHTAIRLYHPEDKTLELLAFHLADALSDSEKRASQEKLRSMIQKTGDGLSGWTVEHRRMLRIDDLHRDPRFIETFPGLQSGMYVPLQTVDRVVGVISIESEKPAAFSGADERLVATLANQAAIALENARLHEETLRQVRQLQSLHAIDLTITSSFNQAFTLDILLDHTIDQLSADAAAIFLMQPYQQTLKYAAGKGFYGNAFESAELKISGSSTGRAILERRMIQVNSPEIAGTQQTAFSNIWSAEGFKSEYVTPLITKGEVKGVLSVFLRKVSAPDQAWISFLETLAGQAAIAIDNSQMFNGLQRANLELAVAYDATIEGWSQAMDLRDKETEGHTQRVTEMSITLAKAMNLGDEEIVHMRRGALLHDIGKLGVPDQILLKPDKLSDDEFLVMKQHPRFAYDMLSSISYLRRALDIPYCHHEKWDGSGYPRGLKGEQIPLAARIFAAVDVWDALTSDRPYRKAWSTQDAMQYIGEHSGTHFDPRVVDAFRKQFGEE